MKTRFIKQIYCISILIILVILRVPAQSPKGKLVHSTKRIHLKVDAKGQYSELIWQNKYNQNLSRFELEKSTDGIHFYYVTALAARESTFIYRDRNLLEGKNYYRLKMIAKNNKCKFSNTDMIDTNAMQQEIVIKPSIATDKLYIWLPQNTQINKTIISDLYGRKLEEKQANQNFSNLAVVDVTDLNAGNYKINMITNTGNSTTLKFYKN